MSDYWSDPRPTAEEWCEQRGLHAQGQAFVSVAMRVTSRPCTDYGCDYKAPCGRHRRAAAVAQRYLRMKGRHT